MPSKKKNTGFTKKSIAPKSDKKAETELEEPTIDREENLPDSNTQTGELFNALRKRLHTWLRWKRGIPAGIVIVLLVGMLYGYYLYASTVNKVVNTDEETPLLEQLGLIFGDDAPPLNGEEEDRINVLLLGIGGEGHAGGTLTDSMIVASIKPSTNEVSLLSLPRDLVIKIYDDENPNYWEGRKINFAYEIGGVELAKNSVSEVTGLDIHYYVLIDFNGFTKVVDAVGGIDVDVESAFTGLYGASELSTPCPANLLYILEDGPYCAIAFERGTQHFDGERALMYSRIRKLVPGSANPEQGSDFARAARQQQVLEAFRAELLSAGTLLRPDKLQGVLHSAGDHVETDMELWEMVQFAELAENIDTSQIISQVVDDSPQGLVYGKIAEQTGAFVLVPRAGEYNFSEIHTVAANVFETVETVEEEAVIQVLNGTYYTGLAAKTAEFLQTYNMTIAGIGNAPRQLEPTTTIYDLSDGKKEHTIKTLTEQLDGSAASTSELDTLFDTDPNFDYVDPTVDFIIILGEEAIDIIES